MSEKLLKSDTHINPGPILNHNETKKKLKQILKFMKLVHLEVKTLAEKSKHRKLSQKLSGENKSLEKPKLGFKPMSLQML